MPWGDEPGDREWLERKVREAGAKAVQLEANLEAVTAPASVFDAVEHALGGITALVLCHVVDIERDTLATTLEDFDRAMAVNVRASWLLVREFGLRYKDKAQQARGRVVAITSDHFVGSLAYGASKGALNRIVLAVARDLAHVGITANLVEPGPTDTGWMNPEQRAEFANRNPLGRVGTPEDCANVVRFLCSIDGGWINGQIIHSNRGLYSRNW